MDYGKESAGFPPGNNAFLAVIPGGLYCFQCGLCFKVVKRLVVDHDHKTGKIRSLLCTLCNTGIGQFKDDVELLKLAIKYLEHYQ